jgi:hypothetical protein
MIQKLIKMFKDELQFIFKLHHQPNIDHDTILFHFDALSVHSYACYLSQ